MVKILLLEPEEGVYHDLYGSRDRLPTGLHSDKNLLNTALCLLANPANEKELSSFDESRGTNKQGLALDGDIKALIQKNGT